MKLTVIDTGYFKLDGGAMFGVVPRSMWERLMTPDNRGLCTWAMRCLLIESGDKKILIDTGLGNKQSEKFFSHYEPHGDESLSSSLKNAGLSFEDVTDVLLTHLHFDHCGGAVNKDEEGKLYPAFPNATYWSHSKHWNWAVHPNAREKASFLKENILPLQEAGVLKFVDEEEPIIPEISYHIASGHTESMICPKIQYQDKTIVYMADLLPSVNHIPIPYVMAYDTRPLITLDEKAKFLEEALYHDFILFLEHDPKNECCTLTRNEKGRIALKDTFKLSSIL